MVSAACIGRQIPDGRRAGRDPAGVARAVCFALTQPEETVVPEIMLLPMRETSWPAGQGPPCSSTRTGRYWSTSRTTSIPSACESHRRRNRRAAASGSWECRCLSSATSQPGVALGRFEMVAQRAVERRLAKMSSRAVRVCAAVTGVRITQLAWSPLPVDDPAQRRPDIARARTLFGWEPTRRWMMACARPSTTSGAA